MNLLDEESLQDQTEDRILKTVRNTFKNLGIACNLCKHLNDDNVSCKAYPDGIPAEILYGETAHNKPFGKEETENGKPILFESD